MSRQVDIKALISHIVSGDGSEKCRLCLGDTSEGQVYLGDTVMMDGDKPVTLAELLEQVTGIEVKEELLCPNGACVSCASTALAAQEFRMFVLNSEKTWLKAIAGVSDISLPSTPHVKSICAFVRPNDLSVRIIKNFVSGDPKSLVNRFSVQPKKTKKTRNIRSGPGCSCPDCGKVFSSPHFLSVHLLNSGQKEACTICGTVVLRREPMVEHMSNVHKKSVLLCKDCPLYFSKAEELEKHHKTSHKTGVYTCSDCGRIFPRQQSFEHHGQMHTVRTCRSCGSQFTNRGCYREHRSQCEPDAKPVIDQLSRAKRSNVRDPALYTCDYCGKTYSSRPQLKNHILWIHLDIRPHQCQWCGKRFYTPARLTEHAVVHTRVRNFECDICGAKLVSKMAAVYHKRRHTGERPYKCEDCGEFFISASRRTEHAKRKHNRGKRLECAECPATFVRKHELKKHEQHKHKTKEENNYYIEFL